VTPDSFPLCDGLLCEHAGPLAGRLQPITWEQGSEKARHLDITTATGAEVHYRDASNRGSAAPPTNTNALLALQVSLDAVLPIRRGGEFGYLHPELLYCLLSVEAVVQQHVFAPLLRQPAVLVEHRLGIADDDG
jgi:hypothetical protein